MLYVLCSVTQVLNFHHLLVRIGLLLAINYKQSMIVMMWLIDEQLSHIGI